MLFSTRTLSPRLAAALLVGLLSACGGGGGGANPNPVPAPPPTQPPPTQPPPTEPPPTVRSMAYFEEGLAGRIVQRLYRHGEKVFAATDAGLFAKTIGNSNWQLLGLSEFQVQAVAFLDAQNWLASVFAAGPMAHQAPQLLETVNGSANWLPVANDFGGGDEHDRGIFALEYDAQTGVLYGTGRDALARSATKGRSWELLDGEWGALSQPKDALALNAARDQVWYGGQNAIEGMVLRRVDLDGGETEAFSDLLPAPAVIKGISFDPTDADTVLATGEGGIALSRDNGATWTTPLGDVDYRFYFQAVFDPALPDIVYTAGWTKQFDEPQDLIVEVSEDRGETWESWPYDEPEFFGGAWSLLAIREGVETAVYIGLYKGGVMKIIYEIEE